MLLCQYEFQFQNEYMGFLVHKIGDLLEIADTHESWEAGIWQALNI